MHEEVIFMYLEHKYGPPGRPGLLTKVNAVRFYWREVGKVNLNIQQNIHNGY
jgi:hypothetical protein